MITIDPNLRGCGVALWKNGTLLSARYIPNPNKSGRGYASYNALAAEVCVRLEGFMPGPGSIIEMPRVYPGMPKTDLNDLLDVCGVGAAVALVLAQGGYAPVQHVFPSEWKGTLQKQKMLERIRSKLAPAEVAVVQQTNKSDTEDILDAVGIGLWRLGRLSTKVYPGAV